MSFSSLSYSRYCARLATHLSMQALNSWEVGAGANSGILWILHEFRALSPDHGRLCQEASISNRSWHWAAVGGASYFMPLKIHKTGNLSLLHHGRWNSPVLPVLPALPLIPIAFNCLCIAANVPPPFLWPPSIHPLFPLAPPTRSFCHSSHSPAYLLKCYYSTYWITCALHTSFFHMSSHSYTLHLSTPSHDSLGTLDFEFEVLTHYSCCSVYDLTKSFALSHLALVSLSLNYSFCWLEVHRSRTFCRMLLR